MHPRDGRRAYANRERVIRHAAASYAVLNSRGSLLFGAISTLHALDESFKEPHVDMGLEPCRTAGTWPLPSAYVLYESNHTHCCSGPRLRSLFTRLDTPLQEKKRIQAALYAGRANDSLAIGKRAFKKSHRAFAPRCRLSAPSLIFRLGAHRLLTLRLWAPPSGSRRLGALTLMRHSQFVATPVQLRAPIVARERL